MKQVFYKGLLALTIAFGVTSCDKNEMDDIAMPAVGVVANDSYSKVNFLETGVSIAPIKGRKIDAASKNASEFSHLYGSGPQTLEILKGTDVVYTGSYTPNDISSLEPATIILANGDYTINTSNSADQSAAVLGFLPYTSTVSVELSADVDVTLQATLSRGFVIADAVRANDGGRITSIVLSQPAVGDVAAVSGELIEDADGDFHGYLVGGTYAVEINYLLDGSNSVVTGSVEITNGVATTLDPVLVLDIAVSSATTTSTQSGFEGTAEDRPSGDSTDYDVYSIGNQNSDSDSDVSDSYTRLVSSTVITTGGVPAAATVVSSTWAIDVDASGVTVNDEDNDGLGQFVPATYSAYAPDFGVQIANFMQTRTLTNGEANINPETVHVLSREVTVSSTGGVESTENSDEATLGRSINSDEDLLDTITRQVTSDEVYTASVDGTHTIETANGSWSIVLDNDAVVADTVDSGAWVLNADGSAAVWEVTQGGNALDVPAFAPVAGPGADLLAAGKQYVAGDEFADLSVSIEDIPAADAEWTTSTVSMELYGVVYTTLYSNTDFALDFVIDVDALSGGQVSYQLVNASLSGDARAIGDLVPADSVDEAIAAAKAYIAAN